MDAPRRGAHPDEDSAIGLPRAEELSPERRLLLRDAVHGLSQSPKSLPCKWFYDESGSRLFEMICGLDEYYLTRTELAIMVRHVGAMAAALGRECLVIGYGAGSGRKTRMLLQRLADPAGYVPVDIAEAQLAATAAALRARFPYLRIRPITADFTSAVSLPVAEIPARRRAVYFPGSTIGNFHPQDAVAFLGRAAAVAGAGGALLIGVDLLKDVETLERAYDDAGGVTAAFNLNLLARLNRELGADFDLRRFRHRAWFDREHGRIEMHLVSTVRQEVHLGGETWRLEAGETIHTENSYKYEPGAFAEIAERAGWRLERIWTDPESLFAEMYLVVA
jgi:L-histidine Nalpha-methyltransferase